MLSCVRAHTHIHWPLLPPSVQDLDDESVIETVDFSEFETLFQVRRFKKSEKMMKREESESTVAGTIALYRDLNGESTSPSSGEEAIRTAQNH